MSKEKPMNPAGILLLATAGAGVVVLAAKGRKALAKEAVALSNLTIMPAVAYPSEPVVISIDALNTSNRAGSYTVILEVDNMVTLRKSVTLKPGESSEVSFQITLSEQRTYTINVNGLTGTVNVVAPPPAEFQVSNLVITPSECYLGDSVNVSVDVANIGGVAGTYELVCEVI